MDLRQLSPTLAVSPQIMPEDVPVLAEAGFKVLVNNRPDDEVGPEIDHDVMAQAAWRCRRHVTSHAQSTMQTAFLENLCQSQLQNGCRRFDNNRKHGETHMEQSTH